MVGTLLGIGAALGLIAILQVFLRRSAVALTVEVSDAGTRVLDQETRHVIVDLPNTIRFAGRGRNLVLRGVGSGEDGEELSFDDIFERLPADLGGILAAFIVYSCQRAKIALSLPAWRRLKVEVRLLASNGVVNHAFAEDLMKYAPSSLGTVSVVTQDPP